MYRYFYIPGVVHPEAHPRQLAALQEVEEEVAQGLQVVSAALLYSEVGVY